jgi:hypothetical protein
MVRTIGHHRRDGSKDGMANAPTCSPSAHSQVGSRSQGGKMLSLINYRLRVTLNDGRQLTGQMLAFDPHMNLVLADSKYLPCRSDDTSMCGSELTADSSSSTL